MSYYVYIIQCDNDTLYTGYSKDVDKRMRLHMKGKGARYLRIHKPKNLIYVEKCASRAEAMKEERRIKLLSHNQKLRLSKKKLKTQKPQRTDRKLRKNR